MSESNAPNTLDRETYTYLNTEYQNAQFELLEKIKADILKKDGDRKTKQSEQLNNALIQPKEFPTIYTNKVVKDTLEAQKQAEEKISAEHQRMIDEEYSKKNAELEGIWFKDFGGTAKSAEELMNLHEANQKQSEAQSPAKDSLIVESKTETSKESTTYEAGETSHSFNAKVADAPDVPTNEGIEPGD